MKFTLLEKKTFSRNNVTIKINKSNHKSDFIRASR
jgi:hypothetical protein